MEQDSFLAEQTVETLQAVEKWNASHQADIPEVYLQLLNRYLNYITPATYKSYHARTHQDILEQILPILRASSQPDIDMKSWAYSLLPEYYAAAKTLLPAKVSHEATLQMAKERPQELIGQFSKLFYTISHDDLLEAVLKSPHSITQFMHYKNRVRDVLERAEVPEIKLMLQIYQKHRYNPNPYYLLPYIAQEKMNVEEAVDLAKDDLKFIEYLLPLVTEQNDLAYVSVQQKWDEIMEVYVRKIKTQRFRPVETWKLDALDHLSTSHLTRVLFVSNNQLNPQELTSFMKWMLEKNKQEPYSESEIDLMPWSYITALHHRIKHDKLEKEWHQLWKQQDLAQYIERRRALEAPPILDKEEVLEAEEFAIEPPKPLPKVQEPRYVIKKYYFNLPEERKQYIKWRNDPTTAIKKVDEWLDASYGSELLMYLSNTYPLEVIKIIEKIKLRKHGIDALKNVAKTAPLTAKNYIISPTHTWNTLFKNAHHDIIQTLYEINKVAGINTRAYLLLDDIYHHRLSIEEADKICQNKSQLTQKMIELLARPQVLGRHSIEQEISARSLSFVRDLNISINTHGSFAEKLYELTPEEIYTFMTYGEDEIIQRSFERMLRHLMQRIPQQNIYQFFEKLGFNNYIQMLQKAAYYDLLNLVIQPLKFQEKNQLVQRILSNLENKNMDDAIQVASFIISLNHSEMTDLVHTQLKDEYERVEKIQSDKGVAFYGILSSLISKKIEQDGWARYVAKAYDLPDLEYLPSYTLFNHQMTNIQQYYFYNDADGIGSFNNFIRSYERSPLEWKINDLGSFVQIESRTGRKVEIYANKAREGEKGVQAMLSHMKSNKLDPQVVVHRGLSTHTLNTFTRIPSSAKLILDGSCGGYYVQQVAIERAPDAQILCNRNVGTMYVNDPLFKQISDEIRTGNDIVWPELWAKMNQRVGTNPYFKDYIPPHKNAATILIKTLYELLEIK